MWHLANASAAPALGFEADTGATSLRGAAVEVSLVDAGVGVVAPDPGGSVTGVATPLQPARATAAIATHFAEAFMTAIRNVRVPSDPRR
jgi:hypothetical protein